MISNYVFVLVLFMFFVTFEKSQSTLFKSHKKPSVFEIEDLRALYTRSLEETNILIESAYVIINSGIEYGIHNVTQLKKESEYKIDNFTKGNSGCRVMYEKLLLTIDSDEVQICEQSQALNAALQLWKPINAFISLCATSTSSQCLNEINTEILRIKTKNFRDIPDIARGSRSCINLHCDNAVLQIFQTEQIFIQCSKSCQL
ncbi:hypothetical protein FQA39_LY06022 [Lamprigera yunnana]|nr:hypothetical protein FQA39_LY06022 [Lamprigera yunnana]